jgi:hypothetical protein
VVIKNFPRRAGLGILTTRTGNLEIQDICGPARNRHETRRQPGVLIVAPSCGLSEAPLV